MNAPAQSSLKDSRVVVAGLGKTGVSAVKYLLKRGATVAATDSRAAPPGAAEVAAIDARVALRVGGFDVNILEGARQLLVSPGISLQEPIVLQARRRGMEILGDIELFARAVRAPVVGITGTNGKSTVTTLVAKMAERAGRRVYAGGNLGEPALDLLERPRPDLYLLELSSFQLESTSSLALLAGVVLNVTSDHMDRYPTMQAYAEAKARIFAHSATAVVNLDDQLSARLPADVPRTVTFSIEQHAADFCLVEYGSRVYLARRGERLLDMAAMKLSGRHNAANALAALALGEAAGLPMPAMLGTLQSFAGLPHRAEWVADIGGVCYVDDSKGTNVGATIAAVTGLAGPLVLIAGGQGKGQDFAPLRRAFAGKVRRVVLIGQDAGLLEAALSGVCELQRAESMDEAVQIAARAASVGDTVLLSPACASLDMFRDYAQRGDAFAAAVRELGEAPT
jgi:UDP-N-acetylmuramoylalanine--D-glutamate ligase